MFVCFFIQNHKFSKITLFCPILKAAWIYSSFHFRWFILKMKWGVFGVNSIPTLGECKMVRPRTLFPQEILRWQAVPLRNYNINHLSICWTWDSCSVGSLSHVQMFPIFFLCFFQCYLDAIRSILGYLTPSLLSSWMEIHILFWCSWSSSHTDNIHMKPHDLNFQVVLWW